MSICGVLWLFIYRFLFFVNKVKISTVVWTLDNLIYFHVVSFDNLSNWLLHYITPYIKWHKMPVTAWKCTKLVWNSAKKQGNLADISCLQIWKNVEGAHKPGSVMVELATTLSQIFEKLYLKQVQWSKTQVESLCYFCNWILNMNVNLSKFKAHTLHLFSPSLPGEMYLKVHVVLHDG